MQFAKLTKLLPSRCQYLFWEKSLRNIDLLVFDVDGVLTDGGLWLDSNGMLQKRFDVRDGLGIRLLQQAGLELALLSGGKGGATQARAQQLGIKHCLVEIKDKPAALERLQQQLGVSKTKTGFVGDDLNDLAVQHQVELLISPADACPALRRRAHILLDRPGGHGAVRELSELILKARRRWKQLCLHGWRDKND